MTLMTLKLTAVPLRCLEIFKNLADLKFRNCRHNNFSGQHLHSHIFWAQLKIDFTSLGSDMTCYTYISQIKRKMCKSLCHIQSFKNTAGSKNCKVGKERKNILTDMYSIQWKLQYVLCTKVDCSLLYKKDIRKLFQFGLSG